VLLTVADALSAARATVAAAVNKFSMVPLLSADNNVKDVFTFQIPHVRLTVHVRQGTGIQQLLQ